MNKRIAVLGRLPFLLSIDNPSDKDKEEFLYIHKTLRDTFIHQEHKVGDKVKIYDNRCSVLCRCYYSKEHLNHERFKGVELDPNKVYTIKKLDHFGGGCPPVTLQLEELPLTHSYDSSVPANWFKIVKE